MTFKANRITSLPALTLSIIPILFPQTHLTTKRNLSIDQQCYQHQLIILGIDDTRKLVDIE